jgi:hypothetical protein
VLDGGDEHRETRVPSLLACLAIARVDEQAPQPRLEAVGIAQAAQIAPGGEQRLLGRILGPFAVPEDESRDGVEPVDPEASQLRERLSIPHHRSLHEVPLHRDSALGGPADLAVLG